jgi:hypothetical protein
MLELSPGTLVRDTLWLDSVGVVLSYNPKIFTNRAVIFWSNGYISSTSLVSLLRIVQEL